MAEKIEPSIWSLATASELGAALQGVRFAITAQDADMKYTDAINSPFLTEGKSAVGLSDDDLFPNGGGRDLKELKARVHASGIGEAIDFPFAHEGESAWYRIWAEPLIPNGRDGGLLCTSVDVTGQKVAEEHLRLALLELAHRSKNLLSVVLSIARQSADESETLAQFSGRFIGRIRSLALAHDVLTDESWRGATVFSLVRSQLSAFNEASLDQSSIEGHNAYLKPNAVQYVGLALHELVALSLLSGALSHSEGHVQVSSTLVPAEDKEPPLLVLKWHESRSEQTPPADKSEFARALLERLVPAALSGWGKLEDSDPRTFDYELRIPSSQFF